MSPKDWKKYFPLFVRKDNSGLSPVIIVTDQPENIPKFIRNKCNIINDMGTSNYQ
jgi:hypothetical protein